MLEVLRTMIVVAHGAVEVVARVTHGVVQVAQVVRVIVQEAVVVEEEVMVAIIEATIKYLKNFFI